MHSLNTTIYSRDVLITRVLPLIYKKEMKKSSKKEKFYLQTSELFNNIHR